MCLVHALRIPEIGLHCRIAELIAGYFFIILPGTKSGKKRQNRRIGLAAFCQDGNLVVAFISMRVPVSCCNYP